jgi:RHS repeat-associated protein
MRRSARRLVALVTAPVVGVGLGLVPVVAVSAASVVVAAQASLSGSALILSTSVNGGSGSAEAQAASALGLSVTVASASAWDSMTQSQFGSYKVIIIGDPSGSSCSASVPPDALSTTGTWEPAVSGDVAIVGTAPALAGTSGAKALISDAVDYAASGSGTGLYVSLNCEDSSDPAGTPVGGSGSAKNWLSGVEGIGKAGGLTGTGQGPGCPAGSVNGQEALAAGAFNGLSSSALAGWPSPACGGQETFDSWPASFKPVAYVTAGSLAGGAGSADFTASDGAAGQPLVLLGAPLSAATAGLAPSVGGQVPAGSAVGGSNPAAPGASQAMAADPVSTENGDFSQTNTDLGVPTFGPPLGFSRTYDAQLAQRETVAGTPAPPGSPGSLGYGWTDNWDTWLSSGQTVPGDIYTIDGLATSTGNGGPATSAAMNNPGTVSQAGGNAYIADTAGNRIEEVPTASGTQWGISMTAGHMYTVVGSDAGASGGCANGTAMASCELNAPQGVMADPAGDLFIADTGNNRVLEVPAASGTHYGISMTAGDAYTVAGHGTGAPGHGGDGGAANLAFLSGPTEVITGAGGDTSLYIADAGNNRVQEVFQAGGETWGQSMTASDIYTVAGSPNGTAGNSGAGGAATSALLTDPQGVSLSSGGDLYIAVTGNNKVQEVPNSSGTQWNNQPMTANDIYNVAGNAGGTAGVSANGTVNTSTLLDGPTGVVMNNGTQMYITDSFNNRIAEIARTSHTEWGISMTANDLYDIAGSASGASGYSGNGGLATAALLDIPAGAVGFSGTGMYVGDTSNNEVRLVAASTGDISDAAGGAGTFSQDGDGGTALDAGLDSPQGMTADSHGDIYVADSLGNRVQEIAAYSHTQFGIAMTAGDVYTIAGSAAGYGGISGDGGLATSALLFQPDAVAVDGAGNVYIADSDNFRVQKVSASTGGISTFAGSATGVNGDSGQGGPAASALLNITYGIAADAAGDVFITSNEQVLEVPAASGTHYGISMTAGHIYTIAGSSAGSIGVSGDGGPATSALFDGPFNVAVDQAGNVYVGDFLNNRVQEVAAATHAQWGISMTGNDVYTVAGSASGATGSSGDGGRATSALLNQPQQVTVDASGNLYIADFSNYKVREVAAASGAQWSQSMTAGDIYTVAGTGTQGGTGDGGPAASAQLSFPQGITTDPSGDVYITNFASNVLREVTATPGPLFATSPAAGATWSTSGITITQPGGSQVTFYPKNNGSCAAPYVAAGTGGYCALPQDTNVNLSYSSANGGTYTYTPSPGLSYLYGSGGALQSETDAAGDTLTVSYGTPLPGGTHCPTWSASCNTITAASGRTLVIGYTSAGLVDAVTDPLGHQYDYTHTGSDLTKFTDPMGNITTYTYDSGNANPMLAHDMLSITGPNAQPGGPDAGDATVNHYDSLGRVTSQTDPMGHTTTFNYCVSALTGNCMNTSTGTGYTTVTDPDGNTTIDAYNAGSLTAQSNWTGGTTLASEQDYVPAQDASGNSAGTQLDTATADGNGNITTTTYQSGYAVTSTAPDGASAVPTQSTLHYTGLNLPDCQSDPTAASSAYCTVSPGPSAVAPGGTITPPSSAPPPGDTWSLYDTDGNELYTTAGVYQPGSSTASYSQTTYQLFKNDSVTLPGASTAITCTTQPPSASLPCATIDADGVVTQLAYDSAGDLTSSSTPDGNGTQAAETTYAYNGDGEQTSVTSPDGNLSGANAGNYTTITAYNADQQKTSVTHGGGTGHTVTPRTTIDGYDASGNQTTAQDPRGNITATTYNADNQATLVTDPDGNATLTCYDGDGNKAQTVPPVGVAASNLSPASCPASYPAGYGQRLAPDATVISYNALGQEAQKTTPAPASQSGYETTTYSYDGDGNLIRTTSPPVSDGGPNSVTVSTYNSAGEMASQTTGYGSAASSTVSQCYDPNGNETSVVYPDGNANGIAPCETSSPWAVSSASHPEQAAYQTTYRYDSAADLVSTTTPATSSAPSGATTTQTYDPAGNKLTSTDPDGVTTTWTYTPLDLVSAVSYSGGSAHSVTTGYDANGSRTSMTDATGTSGYAIDPFGEITSATNGAGQTIGYGYNGDSQVTSITYPLPSTATWAGSDTVGYSYDNADLLTSVTDFNGNQISIGNTADGLPDSVGLGSAGDTISTTYAATNAASAITLKNSNSTLESFTYTDAPDGSILSETDTPASAQSPSAYTYDAQGRVTSMVHGSGPAAGYGFDASGNLTTLPSGAGATYDHAGELTSSVLGTTTADYTYNADGQRLAAKAGSAAIAAGTWNGAGQLTAYSNSAGTMTSTSYDGDGMRATAMTNSAKQSFTWNVVPEVPQLIMDTGHAYIYADGNAPVEQLDLSTGARSYLITDSLGSVRGVVNAAGTLAGTASYDAWGNPSAPGGLTASTPFGYASGYTDPTGLIYLINRYYDPATGQFTSVDPLLSQTQAPYAYADGNPVTNNDPTGTSTADSANFGGTVNVPHFSFPVPLGQMIVNVDGRGSYINEVAAAFFVLLPWRNLYYPSFRFNIQTPKGKVYSYTYPHNIVHRGRINNWNAVLGVCYDLFTWPCAESAPGVHYVHIKRNFPPSSRASTEVHTSLWAEDTNNAAKRGKLCTSKVILG